MHPTQVANHRGAKIAAVTKIIRFIASASSPGLAVLEPLAISVKIIFLSQPTWTRASICKSSDCEGVLILAYPINLVILWLQSFDSVSIKTHRIKNEREFESEKEF